MPLAGSRTTWTATTGSTAPGSQTKTKRRLGLEITIEGRRRLADAFGHQPETRSDFAKQRLGSLGSAEEVEAEEGRHLKNMTDGNRLAARYADEAVLLDPAMRL